MTTSYKAARTFAWATSVVWATMTRMARSRAPLFLLAGFAVVWGCGCRQLWIDSADREVSQLVESRQRAALGFTSDADIGPEHGRFTGTADMYSMAPSPIGSTVPVPFRAATTPQPDAPEETANSEGELPPVGTDATEPDIAAEEFEDRIVAPKPTGFTEALAYAMKHSRQYQSEKELLYLAALNLTLERYLWTPRFVNSILSFDYSNAGQAGDFDQAMNAVANFAVEQRLPYGGEVTARVINTLVRNLNSGVTSGESGQVILDARVPLLRGAGKVAYESRFQAERNLIYAVRNFERFRREFLVDIAGDFFRLLSDKAQIDSAEAQAKSLAQDYVRAKALADAGRTLPIEADRTRASVLDSENAAVSAREQYETSLDFFKIRIGMPTRTKIDVIDESLHLADPKVDPKLAIKTAEVYRLDLINARDQLDDFRRGVKIAKNSLLPQVDMTGSVTLDSDSEHLNSYGYNLERTSWQAGLNVEIPLDRKLERNDYRSSLIRLRRAERDYDQTIDTVRLEVRRAQRRIDRARASLDITSENIRINEFRAAMARAKYAVGQLPSNRDVVEAEDVLRRARNDYAAALSDFRRAVLEFLRDTGTLRIDDDGRWVHYDPSTGNPMPSNMPVNDTPPSSNRTAP